MYSPHLINVKCLFFVICLICFHIVHLHQIKCCSFSTIYLHQIKCCSCFLWSKLCHIDFQLVRFTLNNVVTWYFFSTWNSAIWCHFIAVKFEGVQELTGCSKHPFPILICTFHVSWLFPRYNSTMPIFHFPLVLSSPFISTTVPTSVSTNFVLCVMLSFTERCQVPLLLLSSCCIFAFTTVPVVVFIWIFLKHYCVLVK